MNIRGWNFDEILPIFHSKCDNEHPWMEYLTKYYQYFMLTVAMSTRGWNFDKILPVFHTKFDNEHPWKEFS